MAWSDCNAADMPESYSGSHTLDRRDSPSKRMGRRSDDVAPRSAAPGGYQDRGGNPTAWPDSRAPGRGGISSQPSRGSSGPGKGR